AGFALPVADVERVNIHYRDIATLFSDLRALGETNALAARSPAFLGQRTLDALLREYSSRFVTDDGRLPVSFEIAFLTGWAPHEDQQKPLAPGSAKASLAGALGTVEHSAGEKAKPE